MDIEYEATFPDIDKDDMRRRLKKANAKLLRSEFLQKRVVFNLPKGHGKKDRWLRVRDEGDKITMTLKIVQGDKIENQKETEFTVSSFEKAELLLITLGARKKAYQESKRELWELDGVDVTIDEWPHLEPFLEIEGPSEADVRKAAAKLKLDYSEAIFDSVTGQYAQKYNITKDRINNDTPEIIFHAPNPFE